MNIFAISKKVQVAIGYAERRRQNGSVLPELQLKETMFFFGKDNTTTTLLNQGSPINITEHYKLKTLKSSKVDLGDDTTPRPLRPSDQWHIGAIGIIKHPLRLHGTGKCR